MEVISTWFVADNENNQTLFPSLESPSSSMSLQKVYWQCICTFYYTCKLFNPGKQLVLFSNLESAPIIDGFNFQQILNELGVRLITVPITYRLPPGTVKTWGNQFYILDLIKHIAESCIADTILILDSDIVCVNDLQPLFSRIAKYGRIVLPLPYLPDQIVNGMSESSMTEFLNRYTSTMTSKHVKYYGGEFFAARIDHINQLSAAIDKLWDYNIAQITAGNDFIQEEAQFLSILTDALALPYEHQDWDIKRIWTTFKHNNVEHADINYSLWHVPAEKKYGFAKIFLNAVRRKFLAPPDQESYKAFLGGCLGIPRKNLASMVNYIYKKSLCR